MYGQGYFEYVVEDGSAVVVGYLAKSSEVTVPQFLGGYPVARIASGAFADNEALQHLYVPNTLMVLDEGIAGSDVQISFYTTSSQQKSEDSSPEAREGSDNSVSQGAAADAGEQGSGQVLLQEGGLIVEDVTEEAAQDSDQFDAVQQVSNVALLESTQSYDQALTNNHLVIGVLALSLFLMVVAGVLLWVAGRSKDFPCRKKK